MSDILLPIPQRSNEVVVDDSLCQPTYANFCRVMSTAEEVILDFGLNMTPFATGRQDVAASQRVVMNDFTAKRLLQALTMTIQRHEATFGVIETDVNRRVNQNHSGPTIMIESAGEAEIIRL